VKILEIRLRRRIISTSNLRDEAHSTRSITYGLQCVLICILSTKNNVSIKRNAIHKIFITISSENKRDKSLTISLPIDKS